PKNVTGTVVFVRSGILRFASPPGACWAEACAAAVLTGISAGCCAATGAAANGPASTPKNSARQRGRKRRSALSISFIGSSLQGQRGEIRRVRRPLGRREQATHACHTAVLRHPQPYLERTRRDPRAEKKPTKPWALRGIAQLYGSGGLEASHPASNRSEIAPETAQKS